MLLIHMLAYMPTLGLTNTVAFHAMTNSEKQFPLVRVFGTLGWIAAGLIISLVLKADKTATPFMLGGGAALFLGIFSFVLPHTPPPAKGKAARVGEILGADALSLFRSPSFTVFAIASFFICIPLAAYYGWAGRMVADFDRSVAGWMTIGQGAEVVFMLLMPLFFARLGVKWMLAVGMLSWVVRYALFAFGAPTSAFALIVLGIALHGMCYDFFFVTGFIYTDKRATKEIRGQAQGLLVLITQGLGLGIGAKIMGRLFDGTVGTATGPAARSLYPKFWWACAAFALVVLVIFVLLFRDDSKDQVVEPRGFEVAADPAQSGAV
jgi:nucleoside transporter